jgi:hypothetical protein
MKSRSNQRKIVDMEVAEAMPEANRLGLVQKAREPLQWTALTWRWTTGGGKGGRLQDLTDPGPRLQQANTALSSRPTAVGNNRSFKMLTQLQFTSM